MRVDLEQPCLRIPIEQLVQIITQITHVFTCETGVLTASVLGLDIMTSSPYPAVHAVKRPDSTTRR